MPAELRALRDLARGEGLITSYVDGLGERRAAPPESLLAVLRELGVPIASVDEAPRWLSECQRRRWSEMLDASVVAWDGQRPSFRVRLPMRAARRRLRVTLTNESGATLTRDYGIGDRRVAARGRVGGVGFVELALRLDAVVGRELPHGLHELTVETAAGDRHETSLVAAPSAAFALTSRSWGVAAPLQSLRTRHSLGVGDLDDLGALVAAVGRVGGGCVATLPLLACFRQESADPSPYAPVSKLFWDPLFLDIDSVPEAEGLADAALRLGTARAAREAQAAVSAATLDQRRVMALKRGLLDACARRLFTEGGARLDAFERFLRGSPRVLDYARFRATGERLRTAWPRWPSPECDGVVRRAGLDDERVRFHAYAQWLLGEQLEAVARRARSIGPGLMLDFPVGVHRHGYDVWRERACFLDGCSLGAPPDALFERGQDWSLAPLHPRAARHGGLAYFRDALATQMAYAGVLRIDHVMGLERTFLIPSGATPAEGVYVTMPRESLWALVCLESRRRRCAVVGEDLGTVPAGLRRDMKRRAFLRTVVAQFELDARARNPLPKRLPAESVAMWDSHDTPTFAGFLEARDVDAWEDLGLLDPDRARAARAERAVLVARLRRALTGKPRARPEALRDACWRWLAASRATLAIVSLEDLWLEREPHNTPGTGPERLNWVRRMRHSLEDVLENPRWLARLVAFDSARRASR